MRIAFGLCALALALGCGRGEESAPTPSQSLPQAEVISVQEIAAQPTVYIETEGGEQKAIVEVVSSPATIQRGLMHRRDLAPDRGMLFIFSSDRVRTFWMKNTLIPLDMLFIDADLRIAGIVENTEPLTLVQRTVGIPTRYVLELNAGWTAKHKVKTGMLVRFENMPAIENAPQ